MDQNDLRRRKHESLPSRNHRLPSAEVATELEESAGRRRNETSMATARQQICSNVNRFTNTLGNLSRRTSAYIRVTCAPHTAGFHSFRFYMLGRRGSSSQHACQKGERPRPHPCGTPLPHKKPHVKIANLPFLRQRPRLSLSPRLPQ